MYLVLFVEQEGEEKMPTYEYFCKTCGKTFEYFQRISESPLSHCVPEVCEQSTVGQGEVVRKISGGVGLIFRGDGFYITDYVRKQQKTEEKKASNGKGSTEKKHVAPSNSGSASDTGN